MKLVNLLNGLLCSSSLHDEYELEWMEEATDEIGRLRGEIEALTKLVNSRTEHLV